MNEEPKSESPMVKVTPGIQTSEYKTQKKSGFFGTILAIVGFRAALGETLIGLPGVATVIGVKAVATIGTIVGTLGVIHKTAVENKYIQSRTDVKKAQIEAEGKRPQPTITTTAGQ